MLGVLVGFLGGLLSLLVRLVRHFGNIPS